MEMIVDKKGRSQIPNEVLNTKNRNNSEGKVPVRLWEVNFSHLTANLIHLTWRLIQKVWEFRLVAYKLARIILKTLKNVFLLKKVQEFFFHPKLTIYHQLVFL